MCSFLHVETFMNCRCCSGIYYTCFLYVCLLVLFCSNFNFVFTNRAVRRADMRAQSRLEHTEPGRGSGPTLGCHSGLLCINRMCTIPSPHKTYTFNLHNKESFLCTPKINFPQLQNLYFIYC